MPFHIIRDDITRLHTDAIVNAANTALRQGGGVCGAIFEAAGAEAMTQACQAIGRCNTGHAVLTPGFRLPAKYVIHTVGPVWSGGMQGERELLASAYRSALTLAVKHELHSIAFPLISGGIYGYPKAEAMEVAVESIRDFLNREDMNELDVTLVLYDRTAYLSGTALYGGIRSFILESQIRPDLRRRDEDAVLERACISPRFGQAAPPPCAPMVCGSEPANDEALSESQEEALTSLLRRYKHRESTFSEHLLALIDRTGEKDAVIYKRANLDRRLFSKIRSNPAYQPSKSTVLALCLALHLSREEADRLLAKAGYALTAAQPRDLAVIWCIDHEAWDVYELNMVLFEMDLPGLGA